MELFILNSVRNLMLQVRLRQALRRPSALLQAASDGPASLDEPYGKLMLAGVPTETVARVYGLLGTGVRDHRESIERTSGGPVFGLWYTADGTKFRYTILGVQSGWDRATGQIAAWPIGYIVKFFPEIHPEPSHAGPAT